MPLATLWISLLALAGPRDDVLERLQQLTSPSAEVRSLAERWLAAHVDTGDYAALARAASEGDAEVRLRLRQVLAADARHLGLALAFLAEKDERLVTVGREALRSGIARFDASLAEPGIRRGALATELQGLAGETPPRLFRLDGSGSLAEMAARLELIAELPVGLAVDVPVATRAIRRGVEPLTGPWDDLVKRIAQAVGVSLELHGHTPGRRADGQSSAFLLFTLEDERERTGGDLVAEWLELLATGRDPDARAIAAANLAASGFAPAVEWMGSRLARGGDPAAREGLLRAAARGRVAAELLGQGVLEGVLAEAEARAGDERSAFLLRALAAVGCLDPGGEPLAARLLDGFDGVSARARWARLTVLDQNGCRSPELDGCARDLLADARAPAPLHHRALLILGASGVRAPTPAAWAGPLAGVLRLPLDDFAVDRLVRTTASLDVEPPFRDPADVPSTWDEAARLRLVQAWLARGDVEALGAHLAHLVRRARRDTEPGPARRERTGLLADALQPQVARGHRVLLDEALARARAFAPEAEHDLQRVRLLLGLVPMEEVPELVARAGFESSGPDADLGVIGVLATYPANLGAPWPRQARQELERLLVDALQRDVSYEEARPVVRGIERAVAGLYAARRDAEGEAFVLPLQRHLRRASSGELVRRLDPDLWPTSPGRPVRDVERELDRYRVPRL